jgi:SAM-dependent methyltransferase
MTAGLELNIGNQASTAVEAAKDDARTDNDPVLQSLRVLRELYNYNHWLFNKVRPFIRGRVFEVGSGIGNITQYLLNCESVTGIEPFPAAYRELCGRFRNHLNVNFFQCSLENCPNKDVPAGCFDTLLCLNVLEHITDDADALQCMSRCLSLRGRVVILVPAHMSIYGELDRSFGHYRRYTRRGLNRLFKQAGLKPVHSFYMNHIGYFGWWWQGRILQQDNISPRASWFFNRLVPFLDAFERVVRLPFGQSLVMVGERIKKG